MKKLVVSILVMLSCLSVGLSIASAQDGWIPIPDEGGEALIWEKTVGEFKYRIASHVLEPMSVFKVEKLGVNSKLVTINSATVFCSPKVSEPVRYWGLSQENFQIKDLDVIDPAPAVQWLLDFPKLPSGIPQSMVKCQELWKNKQYFESKK